MGARKSVGSKGCSARQQLDNDVAEYGELVNYVRLGPKSELMTHNGVKLRSTELAKIEEVVKDPYGEGVAASPKIFYKHTVNEAFDQFISMRHVNRLLPNASPRAISPVYDASEQKFVGHISQNVKGVVLEEVINKLTPGEKIGAVLQVLRICGTLYSNRMPHSDIALKQFLLTDSKIVKVIDPSASVEMLKGAMNTGAHLYYDIEALGMSLRLAFKETDIESIRTLLVALDNGPTEFGSKMSIEITPVGRGRWRQDILLAKMPY